MANHLAGAVERILQEQLGQTLDRLALPRPHLVRMDLVPRDDLLKRPIAPKRLKRDLRFQLPGKPASLAHLHSSVRRRNTP